MKKKLLGIALALCLALSLFCSPALALADFTDVPADAGYADAVAWAADTGVTNGRDATTFDPDSTVTRAEAVTFLWRASGSPTPEGNAANPFTDLTEDWYRDAVAWAVETGITNGTSETTFDPDDPVTRTQMATFLYRAQGEPDRTGEGEWYSDSVLWAFDHIMIFGEALPLSVPNDDNCRRSDVVTYLYRWSTAPDPEENADIVILYTSDVHCGVAEGFGYAGLYEIRTALAKQGYATVLVDDGDAIQGEAIGTVTKGEAIVTLMNAMHYDAVIPGDHEFDYGMTQFLKLADEASYPYISCNFNKDGKLIFAPYRIVEAAGRKIAFVGVTTPSTLTVSTPAYFQDENGNYIYGFCQDTTGEELYAAVQNAVDSARAEGAQYVYIIGHMGLGETYRPWSCTDVIAHTDGIDVFLDGHKHDTEQIITKNKDGAEIERSACGTKFNCIGYSHISAAGEIVETGIWSWPNPPSAPETLGIRNEMSDQVDAVMAELDKQLGQVVAHADVRLTINDPTAVDASGNPLRIIRRMETNLGDFCTDAVRFQSGADVAVLVGGGLRTDIAAGDVTYSDIINVVPFSNQICVLEVTGQQLLDALEWGARVAPEENGGFLQVSGMSYEVDVSVPSGCIEDEDSMCAGIEGARRVRNVTVGGQPLDPEKTYTVAGIDYTLTGHGDGYTAFDGATIVADNVKLDSQVLIDYITNNLGGTIGTEYRDPYGQGRITILNG